MAEEAKARADASAPPRKMAGFTLGSRANQALAACRNAGHQFLYQHTSATCSGPAEDVGGEVSVELLFCDGQVCSIGLLIPLVGEGSWEQEFLRVRGALHHNYGPPTQGPTDYPPDCENRFVHCSLEKRMKYRDYWLRDDFRITLEVRQPPNRRAIVIRYR